MRAFHETALKIGIDSIWVNDIDSSAKHALEPGDTVIAADVTGRHLPYRGGVNYVLHNYSGDHPLCVSLAATPERLLRLQVWTTDACGEPWDHCRQFDRASRTLFQPWGSDLLAEEFLEPVFNPESRDITFVGAVWGEASPYGELGNKQTISELRELCVQRGLRFRHLTHVSDAKNRVAVRAARLAPAFAGGWQVAHGYLPCRYFKAAAYGVLAFGNVMEAETLFGCSSVADGTVAGTLDAALGLDRDLYLEIVRDQQRVAARYTYRESLESIERAFLEIRT